MSPVASRREYKEQEDGNVWSYRWIGFQLYFIKSDEISDQKLFTEWFNESKSLFLLTFFLVRFSFILSMFSIRFNLCAKTDKQSGVRHAFLRIFRLCCQSLHSFANRFCVTQNWKWTICFMLKWPQSTLFKWFNHSYNTVSTDDIK